MYGIFVFNIQFLKSLFGCFAGVYFSVYITLQLIIMLGKEN